MPFFHAAGGRGAWRPPRSGLPSRRRDAGRLAGSMSLFTPSTSDHPCQRLRHAPLAATPFASGVWKHLPC